MGALNHTNAHRRTDARECAQKRKERVDALGQRHRRARARRSAQRPPEVYARPLWRADVHRRAEARAETSRSAMGALKHAEAGTGAQNAETNADMNNRAEARKRRIVA